MLNIAQDDDDDLVMGLVESTLTQPAEAREGFLKAECKGNPELFAEVWAYVESEQRMQGFLLEPICVPFLSEQTFQPDDLLEDRFRIVREVAQGGMGVVYEAVDERLGRRIAIKCAKAGFRQQLPPEVRNASEISHPNVCKIFEIHTASTRRGEIDFITMEFLDGETLSQRLKRGLPPEQERQAIAVQLCAGLAEAHRNDVIHGDLKSGNIILTKGTDGAIRAVITDFGLAHRHADIDGSAQSGTLGGTPDYMAPELLEGGTASIASDVYALGVILHELACGRRPKSDSDKAAAGSRLGAKVPVLNAKWNGIVMRCLQPDPASRFRTVEDVERALAPRRIGRRIAVAAASILLAVATWLVTYENLATAKESLALAMLPITSSFPDIPANLSSSVDDQLRRLKGGPRADLDVIPLKRVTDGKIDSPDAAKVRLGVTHILRITIQPEDTGIIVHANLMDTRSLVPYEWVMGYSPGELHYIPVALAGFVTSILHLPPLETEVDVNAAATEDYLAGMALARRSPTIKDAIQPLRRAVATDPDSPLTHAGLAEALFLQYRITKKIDWLHQAEDALSNAERRNPDLPQVHRVVGSLHTDMGRSAQAISEFQRAIELDPNDSEAHRRLGNAYEDSDQVERAQQEYSAALRVEPSSLWAYQSLGSFFRYRGMLKEAIERFEEETARESNIPQPHFALSTAYLDVGRFLDAETELRFAKKLGDSSDIEHQLGYTLTHEDRNKEAIEAYEEAVRLGPKTDLLLLNLGVSYFHVNPRHARQIFKEGRDLAKAELRKNGKNGRVHSERAYLEARLGNSQMALEEADLALSFSSNDIDTRWMVAATYEVIGQHDLTIDLLTHSPQNMLPGLLARLKRYPETASLKNNSEFVNLMVQNHVQ